MRVIHCATSSRTSDSLAGLIDNIGTPQFGSALVKLLHSVCGANLCVGFGIDADRIRILSVGGVDTQAAGVGRGVGCYVDEEHWRIDPALLAARAEASRASTSVVHVQLAERNHVNLRRTVYSFVQDRVLLYGRKGERGFGLSVVTTLREVRFDHGRIALLEDLSELLISLLSKHVEILSDRPDVGSALRDPEEIQRCIVACTAMPRREAEICARILRSSFGISLDLGVSRPVVNAWPGRATSGHPPC
jgi:hypothetical protein